MLLLQRLIQPLRWEWILPIPCFDRLGDKVRFLFSLPAVFKPNTSPAATLGIVRRALPGEAAEGAMPAGTGGRNAQAEGLTSASDEAFLAGERPVSNGPTEGASSPQSNAGRQSLR